MLDSSGHLRILVVDDFEMWRGVVSSILQRHPGWVIVAEASDGLEAVLKATELQPDLVILDIGLPTLSGIEAAKRIGKVAPHSKILFLSQESSPDVIRGALDSGGVGYVYKPRAQTELLSAIETVLGGKQFVSGGLKDYGPSCGHHLQSRPAHRVQFYFDDAAHLQSVTDFIGSALEGGTAPIVMATRPHRDRLFEALKARGVDASAESLSGSKPNSLSSASRDSCRQLSQPAM